VTGEVGESAEWVAAAERVAAALRAAASRGFTAWNDCLIAHLAPGGVRIRHLPPVPELDGWRGPVSAEEYFRVESEVFPKAFTNFRFSAGVGTSDGRVRVELWHRGTLPGPGAALSAVGFDLSLELDQHGRITEVTGTQRPDTRRADLVGWLKAVAGAGGFRPPPPDAP
jgi:hypothetical protein